MNCSSPSARPSVRPRERAGTPFLPALPRRRRSAADQIENSALTGSSGALMLLNIHLFHQTFGFFPLLRVEFVNRSAARNLLLKQETLLDEPLHRILSRGHVSSRDLLQDPPASNPLECVGHGRMMQQIVQDVPDHLFLPAFASAAQAHSCSRRFPSI